MKRLFILIIMIALISAAAFGQEAVTPAGSNTNIISRGNSLNQYDYLLNPAYIGMLEGKTLFFALDNSDDQFGSALDIGGFRAGWAIEDGMGLMMDYRTWTDINAAEVGGADTPDNAEDDYQNIQLTYNTYDQATGTYATIDEDVNQNLKNTTHDHELLFHSAFGLGDGMGMAAQLLFVIHTFDTSNMTYSNVYTNTAAPTAATLTDKGNLTETVNTLLANNENDIALDLEFGLNSEEFITRAVLGVGLNNLRIGNNYTVTITNYNLGAGIDNTIRDQETITANTGQYYFTGVATPSFDMNVNDPDFLSTIDAGIGSTTELPMGELAFIIPFDVGFQFPFGTLEAADSTTTITYDDADADNAETARTTNVITTTLDKGLDIHSRVGGGIRKIFQPADTATVTVSPLLTVSFDYEADTRSRTESLRTQSDNNGDGDYLDAGTDIDTTYLESGYEIKRSNIDSTVAFSVPLSAEWKANDLMTFRAGYSMGINFVMASTSSLITGDAGYIYEQYTDNLTAANSYDIRQKNNVNSVSTPDSNFRVDFNFTSSGSFGASLEISENFILDMMATGTMVEFDAFTVMGIMKY